MIASENMALGDHLNKFQYFYTIARLGSMRKAAESLYITQPSLTKSIQILEAEIGAAVFLRNKQGVVLTPHGQILFDFCIQLFGSLSGLEQRLLAPTDPEAGTLRLGTYDSIGIYFWPYFLKNFTSKKPHLKVEMITDRSLEIIKDIENGNIDLGLVVLPKIKPHLKTIRLGRDSFKFYISKKEKNSQDLQKLPLIFMKSLRFGQTSVEQHLHGLAIQDRSFHSTSSLESVKAFVEQGVGIGLLPTLVAKDLVKKNKIETTHTNDIAGKGLFPHEIALVYHKENQNLFLIKSMIESIQIFWKKKFDDLDS